MISRKEEELLKRQTIERRALPKRIRAERKARDMMFRESLRISMTTDPEQEREKLKKVSCPILLPIHLPFHLHSISSQSTVPRAREEALQPGADPFRNQAHETAGRAASYLRRFHQVRISKRTNCKLIVY